MPKNKTYIFLSLLLIAFSCNTTNQEKPRATFAFYKKKIEANLIPIDSTVTAVNIPVDEHKLKKVPAGEPVITAFFNNVHLAGRPRITPAGAPKPITPGADNFLLPKTISVVEKPVVAGPLQAFPVKDMTFKKANYSGFGSFGKLQGLRNSIVTCLTEDIFGNIWICTASGVSKYDGHSFTNFTTKEGLIANDIRSILQDKSGNIWFGTFGGGVSKYDGYSFINFTDRDGLCNNYVVSIAEDKSGNIWLGSYGGVSKYNGHSFTNFTRKQGLANDSVNSIFTDRHGNIWLGTNAGVSKYNGSSFTNFTQQEGFVKDIVYSMREDKTGNLWFGTLGGGVIKYDGAAFTQFTQAEGLANDAVFSIVEDRNGNVWFGTHYGISKYDGRSFTNFTESQGLENANIYCILEDRNSNLWFGTGGGGIAKYNPNSFTHITEAEGLNKNYVFGIYEDRSGKLWSGTWRGGVSIFDGHFFKTYTDKEGLPYNDVRSICEDRHRDFWLATYKGVAKFDGHSFIYFTQKDGLVNDDVYNVTEDKDGNLWFCTDNGVSKYDGSSFTNFTSEQRLNYKAVNCIKQDKAGAYWFGTDNGAFKYDGKRFAHLTVKENLLTQAVTSISEDKYGNLWFAVTGQGAFRFDGDSVIQLDEKTGLINDDVTSIFEDKLGNLWFGTRFGLSKLANEKLALLSQKNFESGDNKVLFKNFAYADNFLGIGCVANAILQSNNGHIWIATNKELTTFNPAAEIKDTLPPDIQVTAVKLVNDDIDWTKLKQSKDTVFMLSNGTFCKDFNFDSLSRWYNLPQHLSLAYNNNYISFDFAGIDMEQPQNIKYQYQLTGIDKSMSGLTVRSGVSYGNLPPGNYTFIVRAMNSEGYWSNDYKYNFTIQHPWWGAWWFRLVAVISFIGLVFLIVRFIFKQQLRRQKIALEKQLAVQYERQRISADLHDEIGATLSSINIYTGLAKKEENGSIYLDSINQNVNEVIAKLDDLVWSISPRHDSLASIIERIRSYAAPLAQVKSISLHIENKMPDMNVGLSADTKNHLYLILKELLNNATKHSLCQNINVSFIALKSSIVLTVEDDGSGFSREKANPMRNGLHNITNRVNSIKGTIDITAEEGRGTKIIITIPFLA